jgi:tryptophanyl-tRNA synthetase
MPGLDGEKMSKSYGNVIGLRESPESVEQKLRTMPTDPARVRRSDPGDPDKCPVWNFHEAYSGADVRDWVQQGCRSAKIGCLDCKRPIIEAILAEQAPIRERAQEYAADPDAVRGIVADGCEAARETARETLEEVRAAMGLGYR